MNPEEWERRIGRAVRGRRIAQGYGSIRAAAREAGLSEGSWRHIESGRRSLGRAGVKAPAPTTATVVPMAVVLGWRSDWLDRLRTGREPVELADSPTEDRPHMDWEALRRADPEMASAIEQVGRMALARARERTERTTLP